ncbi:DUF4174 domain-containing protein [Alteromonas sp. 5E99-2]|uniref:DUF4174 domain-containing protein n=1 Tax=Alteromonas sp. 5E99-2 TaxID=2817683 RepID=UPI001A99AEC1|nr:DUF4174 domain-containing protein [Alteromonas sp. 5E99-2]MBO1255863.1 DUF4174 domain-containing protein [Alteromonas sp. 5E99-2]
MKSILKSFIFIVFMAFGLNAATHNFTPYNWQYRLVLVNLTSEPNSVRVIRQIKAKRTQLIERKLLVFVLMGDKVSVYPEGKLENTLTHKAISARLNDNKVLLIGLDGQDKHNYQNLILADVFRDIDTMPMRMAELN